MNKGVLATNFAIDFVFADTADYSYDVIYDELSNGDIPEDCIVWEPFEHFDAASLLLVIDNLANDFIKY
jgi:hypothetical protein